MKSVSVDIIIPSYKPDKKLADLISRLGRQTVPAARILIVNTEERFWKREVWEGALPEAGRLQNGSVVEVYHIRQEEFNHGGTRRMAASMSDADVLLFMTQDAVPADFHLTERLLEALRMDSAPEGDLEGCIGAAYARQLPDAQCRFLERYTRSFNYGEESLIKSADDLPVMGIKTYFCSNVCAAYRRDIYVKLGGFEKCVIFNEDMIFAARLIQNGYKVAYAADAKVIHSHNYGGWQQFQRNFDLAVSQADYPEIFESVRSEREGIRLVKKTARYLLKEGKPWLLPQLVWQSGCKYLGYRMGKNYRKLPKGLILKCTSNKNFWKNKIF